MDSEAIGRALSRMAREVAERSRDGGAELAIVGIRRGGVHLAKRLQADIAKLLGREPPLGTLDIALYRDDLSSGGASQVVGPTDIRFSVEAKDILLVDDVLYTGRTIRAALDEIVDFGRPRRVWLAVLVDR